MEFADRAPSEHSLTEAAVLLEGLLRVSQIVRLRFNEWLARFELNDGRFAVLKTLANSEDGGCSQVDLAERLGQSESNVSTLIERMQRDGLVNRLRSEADRRKRVLLISPDGRSTLARVDESRAAWASRLLNGIPAADRSTFSALLRQLGCSLEAAFELPPDAVEMMPKSSGGESSIVMSHHHNPIDDPRSPQFALQKLLLALSSRSDNESIVRDVA